MVARFPVGPPRQTPPSGHGALRCYRSAAALAPLGSQNIRMVQSVELLLDASAENRLRGEWAKLVDAGLPSQGRHRAVSNRPHITLGVARTLTAEDEANIARAVGALPRRVLLGGAVLFGAGPFVLGRLVVPSEQLLRLQERVVAALGETARSFLHQQPGGWTGHLTLARRLDGEQVATALAALFPWSDIEANPRGVRRWDGERQVEWSVPEDRSTSDVEFGEDDR